MSIRVPLLSTRHGRAKSSAALCALVLLFLTACGSSAAVESTDDAAASASSGQSEAVADTFDADTTEPEEQESESAPAEPEEAADEPASPQAGEGNFELVLENGESFSAPVRCTLEPQIAAGSEILFTAGGQQGNFYVDVTQWGETSFGASQDVEISDTTTFEVVWRSTGSIGLELELNGNMITGSGAFYQGENLNGPKTQGTVTVAC